ncbi:MAG: exodeoxyribonuclease V subunit gamma, partial [Chlamydiia bacterium]
MSLRLHVSNRLERLAEALHRKIAGEQVSWGTRCWIVVPSPAMRLWLEEWFCTNSGVFLGPEFCMLDELPDRLNLPGRRSPLPIELGTCLEARLAQQQPQLDPQALHGLARSLGLLFGQYAVFGQHLVQNWHEEVEDWQALLWKELFGPTASWMCTVDRLRGTIPPLENLQIHVIGQSSPPPAYVPFLQRLAEHCPVHVYHLCPSTGWFGDLRSGKELSGLKRRWEAQGLSLSAQMGLEEMILQEQPLLADLGRLHRLTQLQWAEIWSSDQVEDLGVDPTEDSSSLLSALQSDLFWMKVPDALVQREPDCSVSVHLCRSTIVQVEALQQSIAHFLQEHPDCSWSEILITGPSIDQLRMLLESVFREVQWPLRWVDGGELTPLAQWWQALLNLPFQRASTVEVSSLLLHPVLVEACGWDQEQQQELALLLTQWKVWWGWDRDHRASWLQRELGLTLPDHPHEALGTWLQRIRDLFSAHCGDPDRWFCDSSLLPQVGQLLDALGQIHLFCRDLLAEEFTTVGAVARRLLALCESLGLVDRWSEDPALRVLRGIACNQVLEEQRLKSDSCCNWLRSSLQISTPEGRRDGIWVGGLAAVRGIPARAIFIVGMDEDSFPSPWYPEPLNRLEGTDQFPSRGEYDRLCLLEAILGARDRLAIFVACRADLASRRGPSASVQRLIEYLQKAYGCSEAQLIVHHHASLGIPLQESSLPGGVLKEEAQESALIEPSQVALSTLSRSIQNPLHS